MLKRLRRTRTLRLRRTVKGIKDPGAPERMIYPEKSFALVCWLRYTARERLKATQCSLEREWPCTMPPLTG